MPDETEAAVGCGMIIFGVVLFLLLLGSPYSYNGMALLVLLAALASFIISIGSAYHTMRLYGRRSAEGRIWFYVIIMLILILLGVMLSADSDTIYSFFVGLGLFTLLWAMVSKIRSSGMAPRASDHAIAVIGVVLVLVFLSLVMMFFTDSSESQYDIWEDFKLQWAVIFLSLVVTHVSILLARLMGGYISKGWYFMAGSGAVFSVSFTYHVYLLYVGEYSNAHPSMVLNLMALMGIAYSAWFQRRKHLELISGFF